MCWEKLHISNGMLIDLSHRIVDVAFVQTYVTLLIAICGDILTTIPRC